MLVLDQLRLFEPILLSFLLGLPRMLVCCFWIQVFGSSFFPKTIRVGIAVGFSLPVTISVMHTLDHVPTGLPVAALVCKESLLGLLLGFALCTPFWAVESAGALFDNQRGANSAALATPFASQDLSMTGAALRMTLMAFLAATGSLMPLYELLLSSFEVWPVLTLVPDLGGFKPDVMIARFSELAQVSFLYASPLIFVLALIDFGFALVGLFTPNLPTYFAAMPVKSIVGMFILVVYIGLLNDHGADYFTRVLDFNAKLLKSATAER